MSATPSARQNSLRHRHNPPPVTQTPVTPIESNSCMPCDPNIFRITFLRKSGGGGVITLTNTLRSLLLTSLLRLCTFSDSPSPLRLVFSHHSVPSSPCV